MRCQELHDHTSGSAANKNTNSPAGFGAGGVEWGGGPTQPKLGVMLLNLGGPEKQGDVEGFLYNLFADPDIIRLPKFVSGLQKPLATLLSKRRAPQSMKAYESIGGGSPIVQYTTAQARALEGLLEQRGFSGARCYIGMRYWYPFTEQALEEIKRDKVDALVILPLYPQFSISTSGSSLRVLQETFAKDLETWGQDRILHTVVPAWYNRPGYVHSMAGLIANELAHYSPEEAKDGGLHVLFSAHGVPQSYIEAGDPYQAQIQECVKLIGDELGAMGWGKVAFTDPAIADQSSSSGGTEKEGREEEDAWKQTTVHLSYQSRVGPVEWLRPYTDDVLEDLGQKRGVRNLVVVPISFVSEHIETLEEIDIEYRELAEENGVTRWRRCPALNTDARFIEELADLVSDALAEPTLSVSAACIQNNCAQEGDFEDSTLRARGPLSQSSASAVASPASSSASASASSAAAAAASLSASLYAAAAKFGLDPAASPGAARPMTWTLPSGGVVTDFASGSSAPQLSSSSSSSSSSSLPPPPPPPSSSSSSPPSTAAAKKAQAGLTEDAEAWNGRLAMIGIPLVALVEILSGDSLRDLLFGP